MVRYAATSRVCPRSQCTSASVVRTMAGERSGRSVANDVSPAAPSAYGRPASISHASRPNVRVSSQASLCVPNGGDAGSRASSTRPLPCWKIMSSGATARFTMPVVRAQSSAAWTSASVAATRESGTGPTALTSWSSVDPRTRALTTANASLPSQRPSMTGIRVA